MGSSGSGKDNLGADYRQQAGNSFLYAQCRDQRREGRDVIERAKSNRFFSQASPILFIDEIHRFSKSQQDSLLGAVEQGTVTLIGATTENPSFEVIRPLLSRCQLYTLKSLEKDDLLELLQRAITTDTVLKERKIELKETTAMLRFSGGDARKLLNILELVIDSEATDPVLITDDMVTERLQQNPLAYDKDGEMHYDIISAFIKSIRGSDPDGAIYWLARMVEGGEDPAFIARRLVISASEDIGLANPNALLLANACFDTLMKVGWPEGRIPLAEATIYLATSPKSNSAYMAINDALALVERTGNLPVPLHLRNARYPQRTGSIYFRLFSDRRHHFICSLFRCQRWCVRTALYRGRCHHLRFIEPCFHHRRCASLQSKTLPLRQCRYG